MNAASRAQIIAIAALAVLMAAPLAAQTPLLSSSAPGAFGVRYLTDRAVVTYTVEQPEGADAETFTLRVRLPEKVQWGFLDRERIPGGELNWDAGQAVVKVPFGSGRLHLGWAGEACLPPESTDLPVFLSDRKVATLRARFDLEGMQASGEAPGIGPGLAAPRVEMARTLDPDAVSLSLGTDAVRKWRRDGNALEAREVMPVDAAPRLSLRVDERGLSASPIARIVFDQVRPASPALRIDDDAAPEGVLVEGEAFTDATGTPPQVNPGSHHGTHGGSCVYSFIGDGSSLEWEFTVPEEGAWDLYMRMSCGDVGAWRVIALDGEIPAGLELVELPGTGGWGHADSEWWMVRLTGGDGQAEALQLDAGKHTLRMTGVLTTHMNIDYLLLAKHQ